MPVYRTFCERFGLHHRVNAHLFLNYFLSHVFKVRHQTCGMPLLFSFTGSYPSPKAGATLVMHKDLLVLFGGWTRPSPYPLHQPERFFDEIHTYSPSKNW